MAETTTILGVEHIGRPRSGSTAWRLYATEQKRGTKEAQRLLDSLNTMQRAFGFPPIDYSHEFTTLPETGLVTAKAWP